MLGRSLFRTIKSTFGRFLAIFAIIALGVGFFIGLRVTSDAMLETADDYLSELSFYDFRLVSTLGLTDEDVAAFQREPNVLTASGSFSVDVLLTSEGGTEHAYHLHELLPDVNRLDLVTGRLPERSDEIVLDAFYIGPSAVGKTVTLSRTNDADTLDLFVAESFRVVGLVNASYYVNFERGATSLGSGTVAGFAYVLPSAIDADYDTEIFLRLKDMPATGSAAYDDAADAARDRLEALLEERGEIRYTSLKNEADEKIADAQTEIDDGWTKIADGRTEIADAQKKLADAAKELADARKELDDGWAELADAETELADAAQELADARKELDDAKQELADARKELDDGWEEYNDGLVKYEDGLAEYEDGKKKYEDGLAEYEKGLQEYEDGEAEADAQLAAARTQLNNAKAELDATRTQLDNAAAQLAGFRAQLDGAIAQKETLEASLPYLTGEDLTAAQTALATLTAQINFGETQYAAGLAQYNDGETQYAAGLAQYNAGETQYRANAALVSRELRDARRELADAKQELDDAAAELADAETELADAKTELDDALVKLEDGEADYAEGLAKYEDGEAEYADGLAEYEDGLREYEDGKKELEDGEAEYAKGLREYREKSAEAAETIRDAEADIAKAEQDLTEGQEKVDDAKNDLADLKEPTTYVLGRDTNIGYASLSNDTAIVKGIAKVFPLFFFLVAVLVCITTMTRMVEEQRTENGTLKALGYKDGAIIGRYLLYAGTASVLGCFVGFFVGSKFMPLAIWKIYRIMYAIERPVALLLDWKIFTVSTVLYILCALGATWFACRKELSEPAAELIRPKAPEPGKRVLLERIPFIWKRLGFLRKVSVRNIFLYKKRMIMMIIGIGGCTALLLTGFGIRDTIRNIVDFQYEEISLYDAVVTFFDEQTPDDQRAFLSDYRDTVKEAAFVSITSMDLVHDGTSETNVVAFREPPVDFVDLHKGKEPIAWPKEGEAVLNYRLADERWIAVGDTVTLTDDDLNVLELTVTGIFDNYLYDYVFVAEESFERAWGFVPETKSCYLNYADGVDVHEGTAGLLSSDGVAAVTLAADMRETIGSLLDSMDLVVLIVLVCSGALAFIVLYNLTNISITERKREIATLKVLGFYQGETSQYVFRENIILTGIAALFGIPLGILLLRYVMAQVVIRQMYFGCRLEPLSYVLSVALTFVFAILIDLVLRRKIDTVDMAESMKAIE